MSKNHFVSHFLPFKINITIFIFVNFSYQMAAAGHFGYPKITFGRICGHFRSIQNFFLNFFYKMATGAHFGCPKFTFDRISGHFRSIHNFNFVWNFWQNVCRWPFWITFLAILDQYRFFFGILLQNGCRGPFWPKNQFRSHFWPFQIDMPF